MANVPDSLAEAACVEVVPSGTPVFMSWHTGDPGKNGAMEGNEIAPVRYLRQPCSGNRYCVSS